MPELIRFVNGSTMAQKIIKVKTIGQRSLLRTTLDGALPASREEKSRIDVGNSK